VRFFEKTHDSLGGVGFMDISRSIVRVFEFCSFFKTTENVLESNRTEIFIRTTKRTESKNVLLQTNPKPNCGVATMENRTSKRKGIVSPFVKKQRPIRAICTSKIALPAASRIEEILRRKSTARRFPFCTRHLGPRKASP